MPPKLEFEFSYETLPRLPVLARSRVTALETRFMALIDTGADITLLDELIAVQLGLDVTEGDVARLRGVGGGNVDGHVFTIDLFLLGEASLLVSVPVAFVAAVNETFGNLIGLDVLEYVDFGLSHSARVGYLGRTENRL